MQVRNSPLVIFADTVRKSYIIVMTSFQNLSPSLGPMFP